MNSKKLLLLVVVMVSMLVFAGVASAGTDPGRTHAPVCYTLSQNIGQFNLYCKDGAKDIATVQIISEDPLQYSLNWNPAQVNLTVYLKGREAFDWIITDKAGYVTEGSYGK
jgi:hypothetical protein